MKRRALPLLFILCYIMGHAQQAPPPAFITPDTVCVGQEVNIINILVGNTFYWNFCTGNAGDPPAGFSLGNPGGNMNDPRFVTLVKDNLDCYSFITSPGTPGVVRNYHGHSFINSPVSSDNLGSFGVLTDQIEGIQIRNDNGTWYGFVPNGNTLVRMVFSAGLMAPPTVSNISSPGVAAPSGLVIEKDGSAWVGFCLDHQGNTLNRLVFGNSLSLVPSTQNLGNIGTLDNPTGLALKKEGGNWFLLICNEASSTLSRLEFGTTLMNAPTGQNLGNIGGLDHNTGITLIQDCGALTGYVVNHQNTANPLVKLAFDGGIGGIITGLSAGNTVGLSSPYGISEMLRVGDTLYSYVTNTGNTTLSTLYFPVCTASSMASYNGPVPPAITYSTPGTYNIILTVDEGTASQSGSCNSITVIPSLTVSLGPSRIICTGSSTTIDAGPGYSSYQWNDGSTGQTVTTDSAGTFWVNVTNRFGCEASDTVSVSLTQAITQQTDTSVCFGGSVYAGGQVRTTPGTYYDSLQTQYGCDSIIITVLTVKPEITVDLGPDTVFCPGDVIILDAATPQGAYLWQDGSTDSIYTVTAPGTVWARVTRDGCSVADTVVISNCPVRIFFPTAFTPDNDGINDTFRPRGISIGRYRMVIFDRWGTQVFETTDFDTGWDGTFRGAPCEPQAYTYLAWYSALEDTGKTYQSKGTVILVR